MRSLVRLFGVALIACISRQSDADESIFGLPESQTETPGTVVIAGGGKLPDEVYEEFVALAGGKSARLVHIPWAYPFSSMAKARYRYSGWKSFDVRSLDFLAANSRDEADDSRAIAALENATGVWIGGGGQGRLVNFYRGTKVEAALRKVLERGGVIGGTSAGAAVLSNTMIRYSDGHEATIDTGFDLLHGATIDQHFSQRGRHTRLLGVLDKHPDTIGIGVDEGTALFVRGDQLRVLGRPQVSLFVPTPTHKATLYYRLEDGDEALLTREAPSGQVTLKFSVRK